MSLLGRIKNVFVAKSNKVVSDIEDRNAVELGKLDIQNIQKDLNTVVENLGAIKGRIKTLERDTATHKQEVSDLETKAQQLLEAKNEELAGQVCAKIDLIEKEIEANEALLKQQRELLTKHEKNRDTLQQRLEQAKASQNILATMDEVQKSNEALISINPNSAESAVQKFENRLEKKRAELDKSEATLEVQEESSPDSLDKKVDEALGKTPGGDTLARLKAKMQQ